MTRRFGMSKRIDNVVNELTNCIEEQILVGMDIVI